MGVQALLGGVAGIDRTGVAVAAQGVAVREAGPSEVAVSRWACKAFSLMVMVWKLPGLPGGMWQTWTLASPAQAVEAVRANSAIRIARQIRVRFIGSLLSKNG
jgi:hypothetical protein